MRRFALYVLKTIWIFSGLILVSCIDKDVTDIDPTLIYDAEFSLPVGDTLLVAADFVDTALLTTVPDLVDKDTVSWFLYDDMYYFSPGVLYDSAGTPLSISDFFTDTSEIVSITFRVNVVNRIPAKMFLQVYFAGAGSNIPDSLFQEGPFVIQPALTKNGQVTGSWEKWKTDIPFSRDQIDKLMQMQYAIRTVWLYIPDSVHDSIPFYHDQQLWLQMGMEVRLKIRLR